MPECKFQSAGQTVRQGPCCFWGGVTLGPPLNGLRCVSPTWTCQPVCSLHLLPGRASTWSGTWNKNWEGMYMWNRGLMTVEDKACTLPHAYCTRGAPSSVSEAMVGGDIVMGP